MSRSLPRLHRIEFYLHRADGLASMIGQVIDSLARQDGVAPLTPVHAGLAAWASMEAEVFNGGFTQYFYNRRGDCGVEALARLMEDIGLPKAATTVREALDVYRTNRHLFKTENPWQELFGKIEPMGVLDRRARRFLRGCGKALDAWTLQHLGELVRDERGDVIDPDFTGTLEVLGPTGKVTASLAVRRGKPHGPHRSSFDDGSVREIVMFKSGKRVAECWPNGQVKCRTSKRGSHKLIEWFHENGQLQKLLVCDKNLKAVEPIQRFHGNGTLAELLSMSQGERLGPWLKFFEDGSPELEAEHLPEQVLVVRQAWTPDRRQVVLDGGGTVHLDALRIDWAWGVSHDSNLSRTIELRNGLPHGRTTSFHEGVLWSVETYLNGRATGESTLYWDNGRVRSHSGRPFGHADVDCVLPKFDRPEPRVTLRTQADEKLYEAWRHQRLDEYPQALNLEEVQSQLGVPAFLQEVHERNRFGRLRNSYEDSSTFSDGVGYRLTVGPEGEVKQVRFSGGDVYSFPVFSTYPPLLQKLRFTPGRLRGRAMECEVHARVQHTFAEASE